MAHTINKYTFNGAQTDYDISFSGGYRVRANVSAYKEGTPNVPIAFNWLTDNRVRISTSGLQTGDTIVFLRTVGKTQSPVNLLLPNNFTREGVVTAVTHTLQALQEVLDGRTDSITGGSDIVPNPGDGGGGGGAPNPGGESIVYDTYAAALAAAPSATGNRISANFGGRLVEWIRVATGPCLGGGWAPAFTITPGHFGAMGNGIADDTVPMQAALNYLVRGTDKPTSYDRSSTQVLECGNRQYAISRSLVVGNVGNGGGMVYHAVIQNIKLVAIPGDWTGTILPGIPKNMFIMAWRMDQNYTDLGAGVFSVKVKNFTFDCRYLTGGIYLENTNSCTLRDGRVGRLGVNTKGYMTGQFKLHAGHPTGFVQGNGALLVDNLNIGGLEEEVDENFPNGNDQDSMGTIGMRHQSNDARLNNIIISRVSQAADFDYCGAVQITNFHPWSKRVELGPMATNFMFGDCYFDFTPVYITGSFNHYFVGCHWILGNNSPGGHGLFLTATAANTNGAGLILSGCSFRGDIGVNYRTSGGGSWANPNHIVFSGCKFDTAVPAYRESLGNGNFKINNVGVVEVFKDAIAFGKTLIAGNFVSLGVGRTTAGYSGIEMHSTSAALPTATLGQFATGTLSLTNDVPTAEVRLGNSGTGNGAAVKILPSGVMEVIKELGAFGRAIISSNFLALGADRRSNGYAGVELHTDTSGTLTGKIEQFAAGHIGITTAVPNAQVRLGNSSTNRGNALTITSEGYILLPFLPTTGAGLPSGALWNSSGLIRVIP